MQIESIPISKLTLLEKNPRRITKEQMEKLCKSVKEDPGFLTARPVLVNSKSIAGGRELIVYAGNQRVRAAKKLKMKEICCIVENDIPEEILQKRIILDNKQFGEWDFDELANSWDLEMLLDCGFKPEEILGDLSNISDDDRNEKEKKQKMCPHCGESL